MALNCKAGDLAIIAGAKHTKNLGLIVRVISPSNANKHKTGETYEELTGFKYRANNQGFTWLIESSGPEIFYDKGHSAKVGPFPDTSLRPLRDNPGQDETLQWAPVPHKETA